VTERFLVRKDNSQTSSRDIRGGVARITTGDLVGDTDTEQVFVEDQVRAEVGTEVKSGVARIGGDVRRWKYNTDEALRLGENINNQTEVQESIYSVL
jgi:hypothetical protein